MAFDFHWLACLLLDFTLIHLVLGSEQCTHSSWPSPSLSRLLLLPTHTLKPKATLWRFFAPHFRMPRTVQRPRPLNLETALSLPLIRLEEE